MNNRLDYDIARLEGLNKSFEKEHLAAYQRLIIGDAFLGITAENKAELETQALFDQNRFAEAFAIPFA